MELNKNEGKTTGEMGEKTADSRATIKIEKMTGGGNKFLPVF
jgi:hypothetical protein